MTCWTVIQGVAAGRAQDRERFADRSMALWTLGKHDEARETFKPIQVYRERQRIGAFISAGEATGLEKLYQEAAALIGVE